MPESPRGTACALTTGLRAQSKLLNTQVVCPASGTCDTVLTSGYADVFGVPLSLFGALPLVPFPTKCGFSAAGLRSCSVSDVDLSAPGQACWATARWQRWRCASSWRARPGAGARTGKPCAAWGLGTVAPLSWSCEGRMGGDCVHHALLAGSCVACEVAAAAGAEVLSLLHPLPWVPIRHGQCELHYF